MTKMTIFYLLIIACFLSSCSEKKNTPPVIKKEPQKVKQVVRHELQSIVDSAGVNGSILIYNSQKNAYYSNDFDWANSGKLPASTFKIPNSIIALECYVVYDENTLFKWDGEPRRLKIWEQDLIFRDAFHFSCVPCYQEIAREVGEKRMNEFLKKFDYGNMKVDSGTIDNFWLEGDSKISQFEQIDFLKRFFESKLPITCKTEWIMKKLMVIEDNENYKLSGKTGWSIRNGNNNGWFVGYIEVENKIYYFSTNVEPKEQFDMKMFSKIRKEITFQALRKMGIIK